MGTTSSGRDSTRQRAKKERKKKNETNCVHERIATADFRLLLFYGRLSFCNQSHGTRECNKDSKSVSNPAPPPNSHTDTLTHTQTHNLSSSPGFAPLPLGFFSTSTAEGHRHRRRRKKNHKKMNNDKTVAKRAWRDGAAIITLVAPGAPRQRRTRHNGSPFRPFRFFFQIFFSFFFRRRLISSV